LVSCAPASPPRNPKKPLPRGDSQRIDKWLFFARIVKSRSLAVRAVEQGHVRVNRQKIAKPASAVDEGDVITFAGHGGVRVLKVLGLGSRRGPAAEAELLYEDLSAAQKHVPKP
jgi:ribosome-associated heat shock protein Hsp15